jgi:hypothetical protein
VSGGKYEGEVHSLPSGSVNRGRSANLPFTLKVLSPELMVVKQPKFTRVEEPTLLCNHYASRGNQRGGHAKRLLSSF